MLFVQRLHQFVVVLIEGLLAFIFFIVVLPLRVIVSILGFFQLLDLPFFFLVAVLPSGFFVQFVLDLLG